MRYQYFCGLSPSFRSVYSVSLLTGLFLSISSLAAASDGADYRESIPDEYSHSNLITEENNSLAQITPDSTLTIDSVETSDIDRPGNSEVNFNSEIRGLPAELITGGVEQGENLFHSFSVFNVAAGQRVYFDNPATVERIFSRVTGGASVYYQWSCGCRWSS